MAAISLLATAKPAPADGTAGATAPEGASGFAAMMAGVGHPTNARGASVDETKGVKGAKDTKDRAASDGTRDTVGDDDKDKGKDRTGGDNATSTAALLGMPVPVAAPVTVPTDTPVDPVVTTAEAGAGDATAANSAVILTMTPNSTGILSTTPGQQPAKALPAIGDDVPAADPVSQADATALAPVLAALTDTLVKNATVGRVTDGVAQPATEPGKTPAMPSLPDTAQVDPLHPDAGSVANAVQGQPSAMMPDTGKIAPAPTPIVTLATAPTPATAVVLAARTVPTAPIPAMTGSKASTDHGHDDRHDDSGEGHSPVENPQGSPAMGPVASHASSSARTETAASSSTPAIVSAGQELASGVADRHLDLAKQGAWLDGIAHDISAAGSSSGTMRFDVAPQSLGAVSVELKHGDDGAAVTLTTASEAARVALTDATPQLIAEARSHGFHIANAQVDVNTGGRGSSDSQGRSQSGDQSDGRHAMRQDAGFSAQTGTGGEAGRQSQTRSQPLPEYRSTTARVQRDTKAEASSSTTVSSARATDARYA